MIAVITGAGKGIGKAIAIELAKKGYNLAVCARTQEDLDTLAQEIAANQVAVFKFVANCARKNEAMAFANAVLANFGTADVLVNNAGVYIPNSFLAEDDEAFEYQLDLNLKSPYYLSKFFAKIFAKKHSGHIFNICSVASLQPVPNAASYSVTKAALLSLNDAMRNELAPFGVKVTAVLPGATLTPSWSGTTIAQEKFVGASDVAKAISQALQINAGANIDHIRITPLDF